MASPTLRPMRAPALLATLAIVLPSLASAEPGAGAGAGDRRPFAFLVYGDDRADWKSCEGNGVHRRLVERMAGEPADLVVNVGDMVAGYGKRTNWVARGDCPGDRAPGSLQELVAPLQRRAPAPGLPTFYFPVLGNHDDRWAAGGYPDAFGGAFCDVFDPRGFVPNHTRDRRAPEDGPRLSDAEFQAALCSRTSREIYPAYVYYAFDHRNAHFVVLRIDSEDLDLLACSARCDGPVAARVQPERHQLDWLRRDLARAAARPSIEHVFVFLHAPLVTAAEGHPPATAAPVLLRELSDAGGKVRVVFAGHNHLYERSHPVRATPAHPRGERDDAAGIVNVVTGGGGAPLYRARAPAPLIAKAASAYHYLRVEVRGAEVRARAIGLDGEEIDEFTLRGR